MLLILVFLIFRISPEALAHDANFEAEFLTQVNTLRKTGCICDGSRQSAVSAVKWNASLELSATRHAQEMMRYDFFDHYSRGGKGVGERVKAVGYPWKSVGENLARGQRSISEVIEDWQKSPTHCQLLMNPKFKEMGAAHVGEYWVLHMGARKE